MGLAVLWHPPPLHFPPRRWTRGPPASTAGWVSAWQCASTWRRRWTEPSALSRRCPRPGWAGAWWGAAMRCGAGVAQDPEVSIFFLMERNGPVCSPDHHLRSSLCTRMGNARANRVRTLNRCSPRANSKPREEAHRGDSHGRGRLSVWICSGRCHLAPGLACHCRSPRPFIRAPRCSSSSAYPSTPVWSGSRHFRRSFGNICPSLAHGAKVFCFFSPFAKVFHFSKTALWFSMPNL